MEIELEVAAASANEFLKRPSPERIDQEEARQEIDSSPHDDAAALIPQLTSNDIPQEIPVISSSQPGKDLDSSQDQV